MKIVNMDVNKTNSLKKQEKGKNLHVLREGGERKEKCQISDGFADFGTFSL